MSASEKLKALDTAMEPAPITATNAAYCDTFDDEPHYVDLRNALPQIVAVVEAAERAAQVALDETQADRHAPILRREVAPALAALDEALGAQGCDTQPIKDWGT